MKYRWIQSLIILFSYFNFGRGFELPEDYKTCDRCIQLAGSDYGWCPDRKNKEVVGCVTKERQRECSGKFEYLESTLRSSGRSETMEPVNVEIQTRPNKPQEFMFKAAKKELRVLYENIHLNDLVKDNAVDIYFLFDLSGSMKKIKDQLASISEILAEDISKITSSRTFGFGGFREKPIIPFDIPRSYQHDFEHFVAQTEDVQTLVAQIKKASLQGNADNPEGGLDGLQQVILCEDLIGWRQEATHIIIYLSDAVPHVAGDGKLGGTWKPMEDSCKLAKDDDIWIYNSVDNDYPSLSQINYWLQEKEMYLIFGVQDYIYPFYEKLVNLGSITGSAGQIDSRDTRGQVLKDLVVKAYENIQGKLTVRATGVPAGVRVNLTFPDNTNCPERMLSKEVYTIECNDVKINQLIEFMAVVEIDSELCVNKPNSRLEFQLTVFGQTESRLTVRVNPSCSCSCSGNGQGNRKLCSGQGQLVCGACACNQGYTGDNCECQLDTVNGNSQEMFDKCLTDIETLTYCSGVGQCRCGKCICNDQTLGRFCECNQADCINCVNGECVCEGGRTRCQCHPDYDLDETTGACTCPKSTDLCRDPFNREICSGHGECSCGQCLCGGGFAGTFCQVDLSASTAAQTSGSDAYVCSQLEPCLVYDTFEHLAAVESEERETMRQACEATRLKANSRYECFKILNGTDGQAANRTESANNATDIAGRTNGDVDDGVLPEERSGDSVTFDPINGTTPHCQRAARMPSSLKSCQASYKGCSFEFWHDAMDGFDNYNLDNYNEKNKVFVRYYNKTNNTHLAHNTPEVDLNYTVSAVICPVAINKLILIGSSVGAFVFLFVVAFMVYFILINLYDRWEYERFLNESRNIFDTGNVRENPMSRAKSRMSIRNIRNRTDIDNFKMSRMSLRPS